MTDEKRRVSVVETADPDPYENEVDVENSDKKLKYPKSVFFIVSNEFCERFSFYGMRTILALYLRDKLLYTSSESTVIYHTFIMFAYFFPLLGAMLADSLLGKFRTIFYLSVLYAAGQVLLAGAAVPNGIPMREFSIIGLLLISIGTGGIKPCVSAFGGDQFVLPQQERYLVTFFSFFYFAINSGSLVSSFLTPELRNGITCFGEKDCYSLAFIVPAALMVVSIVIFLLGKPFYRMKKPEGNVVLNVVKCISRGIYNKTSKKMERDHWLDHADDKYSKSLINDIKDALRVLTLFIPLPIFWSLFDQQGSGWTFQASRMDGQVGSFLIKPDQIQVMNPILIVIMIPIFETCIYPLMAKINFINTPLKKLATGGFLAAFAFVISGLVELQLQTTYPQLPTAGNGQLRLFNPQQCRITGDIGGQNVSIAPFDVWTNKDIEVIDSKLVNYTLHFGSCDSMPDGDTTGSFVVKEDNATSYALFNDDQGHVSAKSYIDAVNKTIDGKPAVRALIYHQTWNGSNTINLTLAEKKSSTEFLIDDFVSPTNFESVNPGDYDVWINGKIVNTFEMKLGGVYTILGHVSGDKIRVEPLVVTQPNSMHMLWLVPQYVVITTGEVMFSVTGLEFAFTQAPASMKSLLQASWLLTVAFGNLIDVIIAQIHFFPQQSTEFFFFAALMAIDMLIFALMAKYYTYVEPRESSESPEIVQLEETGGHANATFGIHDEKL